MIRFIDNDDSWSNDIVVSFGYEVRQDEQKGRFSEAISAIRGGHQLTMTTTTLGEVWNRYELGQARNLSRVVVPTNENIRREILQKIERWNIQPEELGNYTLLGNNCVSVIVDLLKESGVPLRKSSVLRPNAFTRNLFESGATWMAPLHFKSKLQVLKNHQIEIDSTSTPFSEVEFERIINKYSDHDILELMVFNLKLTTRMIRRIRSERGLSLSNKSFEEIAGHRKLPNDVYELCEEISCTEKKKNTMASHAGPEYIKASRKLLKRYPNYREIPRNKDDDNPRIYHYPLSESPFKMFYQLEHQTLGSIR